MKSDLTTIKAYTNQEEKDFRKNLIKLLKSCPIPEDQILSNLGLYLTSKDLSRILFMDFLFKKIVDVPGVVIEFGTRWGQNIALFSALRGIYDPYNRHRKIIGFDTFSGFLNIKPQDGKSAMMIKGNLSLSKNYYNYLSKIMDLHEKSNPISHIKKYELIKGDAEKELRKYLEKNPETIISLAFFDFDLYSPTKTCLSLIKQHIVRGSILAFDELNDHDSPGETIALAEVFGLNNIKLKRYPYTSRTSYFIVE